MLEALDYAVVTAEDGAEAMDIAATTERIDLLLTDMVLPGGMNGVNISDEIKKLRPEIKCLFMSGYAAMPDHQLPDGIELLAKPVDANDLTGKIRQAMDT